MTSCNIEKPESLNHSLWLTELFLTKDLL